MSIPLVRGSHSSLYVALMYVFVRKSGKKGEDTAAAIQ